MNTAYPKLITISRHGEAEQNVLDPDQRSSRITGLPNHRHPLTERGRRQAKWLGERLAEIAPSGFDAAYVSPYHRTWETREIALPHVKPDLDARISERWRGVWHTHGPKWVDQHLPWERQAQTAEGWYHNCPSGGESVIDVEARVASFLTDLRLRHAGERVAIFAHNTTTIAFLRHALNLTIEAAVEFYEAQRIVNCFTAALVPTECGRRLTLAREIYPPSDI